LAIFGGVHGISALVLAAALVAGHELASMARSEGRQRARFFAPVLVMTAAGVAGAIGGSGATLAAFWGGVAAGGIALAALFFRPGPGQRSVAALSIAALYFGAALAHAAPLSAIAAGRDWLLLAVLTTFAVDSGAYFAGSVFGSHRLAPSISPRKSWEGVAGGLAAGAGAVIGLNAMLGLDLALWAAAVLGLGLTVSGVSGDLYESWLKRRAGVKDSGALVPGHGGILDRIDSLAPNIAVVYWAAQWSMA
jgi:phosphatidate cytidylyltransferase